MTNTSKHDPEALSIDIEVRHQNRRTMLLRVKPDGDLVLLLPYWLKLENKQVQQFVQNALQKIAPHIPEEKPQQTHDADSVRALVKQWALCIGVQPKRVQMRTMYRKWGSCSYQGTITLNTALYYLPHHLVEYVIVHELVHMLVYNHSADFWNKVGEYLPDYANLEQELERYHV